MNHEALESFRVFSETLNFTHAAERRHLTQPALHKQIQNLAEDLQVELYRRVGRSLQLTEAGIALAKFSRELGDRINQLRNQLQPGTSKTKVTLAAGRGGYLYLLEGAIKAFAKKCPESARYLTSNRNGTLEAIRSGKAHLGITVLGELPNDLRCELLCEIPAQLVVSSKSKLAKRKSASLSDLNGLPLICPPPGSPLRDTISALLTSQQMEFNPVLDAEGWELLMHFAALGLGSTVVNGCCRPPRGATAIPLKGFPTTKYYLVSHLQQFAFPELTKMRQCILDHVSRVKLFAT